jgi:hypothetical protein
MVRASRTVLVEYKEGRWTVRRVLYKRAPRTFATKSEAVAAAKAIALATQPSQVTIIGRDGRLQRGFVYGLPRIPRSPYRGAISDQIERAVLKVSDMMEARGE